MGIWGRITIAFIDYVSHESKKAKRNTTERKTLKPLANISKKRAIANNESYPYQLLYRIVSIFNYTSWT
jgi:hypothetical protein